VRLFRSANSSKGKPREKLETEPLPVRRTIEYALGIAQGLAGRAFESGLEIRVRLRAIRRISLWLLR